MKHFVYALYSPSYKMVKIGKTQNFAKRWKDLGHWHFDEDKSFALYCSSSRTQKRIEDTLHIFFDQHPSFEARRIHQDGYTECFDERIIEEIREFFRYFTKHYSHDYSYIENIKPFIGFPNTVGTGFTTTIPYKDLEGPFTIMFGDEVYKPTDEDLSDF